jgi:M6 family metalloprotease-like protein
MFIVKPLGLVLSGALLLSGCTAVEQVTTTASTKAEVPVTSPPVEEKSCDTAEIDPLVSIGDRDWGSYSVTCETDATTPTTALSALDIGTNLEPCKLIETSAQRKRYNDNTSAFPRASDPSKSKLEDGNHRVMVIALDWPDLKDRFDPVELLQHHADQFAEWYAVYSRGKVALDVVVHPEKITLEKESAKFSQSESEQTDNQWGSDNVRKVQFFWKEALAAADPFVDFTDVEMVMFVLPRTQTVIDEFNLWPPGTGQFKTDEAIIDRGFTAGTFHFQGGNKLYSFWVHETLHYFKVPDLYWVDQGGTEKETFSEYTVPAPIYSYDVMSSANSMRSLNNWILWLLDWAEDEEFRCLDANSEASSFEIASNHLSDDRVKAVMLRVSESDLIVIESRRETKFDEPIQRSRNGVLIYHVDATLGHGEGALTLLAPKGRTLINVVYQGGQNETILDAMFYEGNTIEVAGHRITVNEALETSDIVSISKVEDWVSGEPANYVCITLENRVRPDEGELGCSIVF